MLKFFKSAPRMDKRNAEREKAKEGKKKKEAIPLFLIQTT